MSKELADVELAIKQSLKQIRDLKLEIKYKKVLPVLEELNLNISSLAVLDSAVKQAILSSPKPEDIDRIAKEINTGEFTEGSLSLMRSPRLIISPDAVQSSISTSVAAQVSSVEQAGITPTISIPSTVTSVTAKIESSLTNLGVSPTDAKTLTGMFETTEPVMRAKEIQTIQDKIDVLQSRIADIARQQQANMGTGYSFGRSFPAPKDRALAGRLNKELEAINLEIRQLTTQRDSMINKLITDYGATPQAILGLNIPTLGKAIANVAAAQGQSIGSYMSKIRQTGTQSAFEKIQAVAKPLSQVRTDIQPYIKNVAPVLNTFQKAEMDKIASGSSSYMTVIDTGKGFTVIPKYMAETSKNPAINALVNRYKPLITTTTPTTTPKPRPVSLLTPNP